MSEDPKRWSQPFAALLGAYDAQLGFGLPSIGGKLNSESILKSFYGSLCITLFYYNEPDNLSGVDTFKYLIEHVDIEKVEDVAEKSLNIRGDKARCDELWDMIYGYVKGSLEIFEKITPAFDVESAVIDATESAYMMGMMYAIK